MKVVIFCGGLGVRMGEATQRIPKPMIAVGSRPILWHIMKWYASWGHTRVHPLSRLPGRRCIKQYFLDYNEALSNDFVLSNGGRDVELLGSDISDWRITFVDTGAHRRSASGCSRCSHLGGDEYFLATYGDGLTDVPCRHDRNASVQRARRGSSCPCGRVSNATSSSRTRTASFRRSSDLRARGRLDQRRLLRLPPNVLDDINPGEELVDEPFARLIEQGELLAYRYDGFWEPMDTMKDKQRLDASPRAACPLAQRAPERRDRLMLQLSLSTRRAAASRASSRSAATPTTSRSAAAGPCWRSLAPTGARGDVGRAGCVRRAGGGGARERGGILRSTPRVIDVERTRFPRRLPPLRRRAPSRTSSRT